MWTESMMLKKASFIAFLSSFSSSTPRLDSGRRIVQICQKSRRIGCVIPRRKSRNLSFDIFDISVFGRTGGGRGHSLLHLLAAFFCPGLPPGSFCSGEGREGKQDHFVLCCTQTPALSSSVRPANITTKVVSGVTKPQEKGKKSNLDLEGLVLPCHRQPPFQPCP